MLGKGEAFSQALSTKQMQNDEQALLIVIRLRWMQLYWNEVAESKNTNQDQDQNISIMD